MAQSKLDDNLLRKRLDTFLGYGNLNSKFWFVGIEEGGARDFDEIAKRLDVWNTMGCAEVVDNRQFHLNTNIPAMMSFFSGSIPLQSTWRKLIHVQMNYSNMRCTVSDVKGFQNNHWGQSNSNNCLLDFYPLPSKSTNDWEYGNWSQIPELATRETYQKAVTQKRIDLFRQKIQQYKPDIVLFYARSDEYVSIWSQIAGVANPSDWEEKPVDARHTMYVYKNGSTKYVITYQPAYVYANGYWDRVGRLIK